MKKIAIILTACLLFTVSFAGCGQVEKEAKSTVSNLESSAEKVLKEGEEAVEGFVSEIQKDVKSIEETLKMDGKATLEILKEDEKTVKYKFTVAEEAAATEVSELEKKAAELEEKVKEHLEALKKQGIADAQAVVQFVDKEGKELYSKIYK